MQRAAALAAALARPGAAVDPKELEGMPLYLEACDAGSAFQRWALHGAGCALPRPARPARAAGGACADVHPGYDQTGGDGYREEKGVTQGACCAACGAEAAQGCDAWVFAKAADSPDGTTHCWLIKGCTGNGPSTHRTMGFVSAGPTPQPAPPPPPPPGSAVCALRLADLPACVDCNGCGPGQKAHMWACDSGNGNQQYNVRPAGNQQQNRIFESKRTGLCIHPNASDPGAALGTQPCDNTADEQFTPADGGQLRWEADPTQCLAASGARCSVQRAVGGAVARYCDASLAAATRAADLVERMTLHEKIAQLGTGPFGMGAPRLGLPSPWFNEALHGVASDCGAPAPNQAGGGMSTGCATSFPHHTVLGASFNRSMWTRVADAIGTEARALANQGKTGRFFWAPDINLARDPRWGRGQETTGEDPFLEGEFVARYAPALQHGDPPSPQQRVVATAKHAFAYDCEQCSPCTAEERGAGSATCDRQNFDALIDDRDIVEYYWPAFRAAVQIGRVSSIMCSYNGVNGVPSCGNGMFLNEVVRGAWNWTGYVVSDCNGISEPFFTQWVKEKWQGDPGRHVLAGMTGGCDMGCDDYYGTHAAAAVAAGTLPESVITTAVERIYTQAIAVGILDDDLDPWAGLGAADVDTPASRRLAQEAAEAGMTLLKNDPPAGGGAPLLPLAAATRVAVVGPHLNSSEQLLSIYYGGNAQVYAHTPLLGLLARGAKVEGHALGCGVGPFPGTPPPTPDPRHAGGIGALDTTPCTDASGFAEAAALAGRADVALVFVGLHPHLYLPNNSADAREDEGADRPYTTLPGQQEGLIQAVLAANPRTVVVLVHGGSLSIDWTKAHAPAILDAHYPGEMGGDAVARALYGDYSPAGRLTQTVYPASFNAARAISDMGLRTKGGITYKYYTGTPLWPFGFGLSYTTFRFEVARPNASCTTAALARHYDEYYSPGDHPGPAAWDVTVTNTGARAGDCVVLGFVGSAGAAPGDAPARGELFAFDRAAALAPGASRAVSLSAAAPVVALVDRDGTAYVAPGDYDVAFGVDGSAEGAPAAAALRVTGPRADVFSLPAARAAANAASVGAWRAAY